MVAIAVTSDVVVAIGGAIVLVVWGGVRFVRALEERLERGGEGVQGGSGG